MEELINKVENLISAIDRTPLAAEIKELNEKVKEDEELIVLLKEYELKRSETAKNKIISNKLFQKYKEKETDINLLIMGINQKLKSISNKGSCNK